MTKPKRPQPIESYSAPMFSALIEGSRKTYHITLPYRDAVKFRIRAHQLRNRMFKENHELYPIAAKTQLSISWDTDKIPTKYGYRNSKTPIDPKAPVTLTIGPADHQFNSYLKDAGMPINTPLALEEPTTKPTSDGKPAPSLDELLKDWDK